MGGKGFPSCASALVCLSPSLSIGAPDRRPWPPAALFSGASITEHGLGKGWWSRFVSTVLQTCGCSGSASLVSPFPQWGDGYNL